MMVARPAGNVPVSGEQRVVEQQSAQFRLHLVEWVEIVFRNGDGAIRNDERLVRDRRACGNEDCYADRADAK